MHLVVVFNCNLGHNSYIMMKKGDKMKYDVYQFVLSDSMIDEVNSSESQRPVFYEKYLNVTWKPTAESILEAKEYFKKVATIEAENFGQVFEIGNIGPEENITRHDRMHSVSVGDVIVREDGTAKFVDRIGFGSVSFN